MHSVLDPRTDCITSDAPKVSVCIPSYNHGRYLPKTLDSVLGQTFRDFEVVVVDDASNDNSLAIAREYARLHPRIRVFQHPNGENRGISASWNRAITESRGKYLAWLGSDDAWYPQMIETQVAVLDRQSEVGLVYAQADVIGAEGEKADVPTIGHDVTDRPDAIERVIECNPIPALTAVVRRQCFDQLGGFNTKLVCSDWEMWLRILSVWRIAFVKQPLAMYRIHGENISIGCPPEVELQRQLAVTESLLEEALAVGGAFDRPRVHALLDLQAAYFSFQLLDPSKASFYLRSALITDPTLAVDAKFMSLWIRRSASPWSVPAIPRGAAQHFGRWLIAQLALHVTTPVLRILTQQVVAVEYTNEIGLLLHAKKYTRARTKLLYGLVTHPTWVLGRNRRRAAMRAILGLWE